jgi:hypothetical protein
MTNFSHEEAHFGVEPKCDREFAIIGMALRYMLANLDDVLDAFYQSPHKLPKDLTESEVEAVFNKHYMLPLNERKPEKE